MSVVALLGNPNVGKTTLFNYLTGSKQYVGNWPGVTVDKKEGFLNDTKIVDLPGIYAMDTFSNEEKVSKQFLESDEVDLILNIVDGANLLRNLYLTTQLKQFNKPIILAINMVDVAASKGIVIDYKKLESLMNIKVMPISAAKKIGLEELKTEILKDKFELPRDSDKFNFEGEKETYAFLESVIKQCNVYNKQHKSTITDKIDKIVLNPYAAYPIFILMMLIMFQITFSWVGQPLSDLLDTFLTDILTPFASGLLQNSSAWFQSLIIDGIIGGVGRVVVLLPIILSLFACITFLQDSGYMARVAFIMDKLMRKMGLSGKAFIPMIVGFGCTVPAIMSARTLESEKDRKLTALLVPLMSCNARLPVYAMFVSVFFTNHQGLVVSSLYLLGIMVAYIMGILFKNTLFKKDEEPFIIELPEYKLPTAKAILKEILDKAKNFLVKAGTLIFAMSVIIWFLSNFNITGLVTNIDESILAKFGSLLVPVLSPLGFGNWQSSVSLITGLLAKETIVATMQVIYTGDLTATLPLSFNPLSAYAFLVFILLYTPCVSVIGTMKKEYGSRFTVFSVFFQLVLAWVVSFLIFNIGRFII